MTQEIKDKLEQAARNSPAAGDLMISVFKRGAQTILDNPGEWGFVPKSQHEHYMAKYNSLVEWYDKLMGTPCEQVRHLQEIELLKAENTRLREALDRIIDKYYSQVSEIGQPKWIAKELVEIAKEAINHD